MKEKEYLYWLIGLEGIGPVKIKKLREYAGNFEAVYNMKKQELSKTGFLTLKDCLTIEKGRKMLCFRAEAYHRLEEAGIRFITPEDETYPERLKPVWGMPMGLFVKGKLPDDKRPSVAIIGARNCTFYGREEAEYLGRELSKAGIQIISGLAYGIDAAGHKGVLEAGGAAFGVLGSGIDICYPRENWMLYKEIQKNGGVISEYEPGTKPNAGYFPARNRIISGLSDAVIVIEARKRSGSLITVGFALEQGKEVYAVPGRVTDPLSAGCNNLIQEGASVLLTPEDILDFFCLNCEEILKIHKKSENGLAKNEKMLYSCLDSQPRSVEEIMNSSKLPAGECIAALLKLELDGYIVQTTNQYYMRKLE